MNNNAGHLIFSIINGILLTYFILSFFTTHVKDENTKSSHFIKNIEVNKIPNSLIITVNTCKCESNKYKIITERIIHND